MTQDPQDPPSSRAGEYVLGTLRGAERDAFENDLARDPQLRAEVQAWERRLAPLAGMIAPEQPSPNVWAAIERRLDTTTADAPDRSGATVVQLRRSVRFWRGASLATSALAAALAILAILPGRWQVAEPGPGYVAVVNRGGDLPALIVRVDPKEGVVKVRSLAAEAPSDHSLELWYVRKGQAPKSLGLIENAAHPIAIPASMRSSMDDGMIAVTMEPRGGSPTSAPTGPMVYSGKLIKMEQ